MAHSDALTKCFLIFCSSSLTLCFNQVTFSAVLSGNLITSGVGHIRFWKMATTFTGLKLEVQIFFQLF